MTALEDDGVRVVIDRASLADIADKDVHRVKLKIIDADVLQFTTAQKTN